MEPGETGVFLPSCVAAGGRWKAPGNIAVMRNPAVITAGHNDGAVTLRPSNVRLLLWKCLAESRSQRRRISR